MRQFLCPTLVGRHEEFAAGRAAVADARAGRGGLLLVTGEPGIGKSRLARTIAEHAAGDGVVVMWGRATAATVTTPFRPMAEALLSVLRAGLPDAEQLRPYLPFLGRLVPEWSAVAPAEQSLVLVGEAILRLLRVIARDRGCLLVLEDLHWADPDTLAVVEYLADNVPAERVLCLVTSRTAEDLAGAALVHSLRRRRVAGVVELTPLAGVDVERMAAACLGCESVPGSLVEALTASAEGVPFLVEELLAAWVGDGVLRRSGPGWAVEPAPSPTVPVTFADTVNHRISGLGHDARSVLEAAAVLGRRFDWSLLPEMTGRPEPEVVAALRAAVTAQLLQAERGERPDGFRFRHALTRDAVLAELLPPEQAMLARRALDALAQRDGAGAGEADQRAVAADLALQAGQPERAGRLLHNLGGTALRRGALDTAEMAFARARRLAPPGTVLWLDASDALVDVFAVAGRPDAANEIGSAVLDVLPSAAQRAVEMHLRLARACVTAERWDLATVHLDELREVNQPDLRARAAALAAQVAIGQRRPADAHRLARSARDVAEAEELPEVVCEALEVLGRCARLTDLASARALFDQAVTVATEHDLPVHRMRALHERATIDQLDRDDMTGLQAVRDLAVAAGAPALTAVLDIQLATGAFALWQPERMAALAERAAGTARRLGLRLVLPMALLWQACACAQAGDGQTMEELIREALTDANPDVEAVSFGGWCRAMLALVQDDRAATLAHLDASERLIAELEGANPWAFRGLRAFLRTVAAADAEADAARAQVRSSGATVFWMNQAWLDLADAVAAGRNGDVRTADELFRRGDEGLALSPWLRQWSRRQAAEAALADGWGDPVGWLREAVAFFTETSYDRVRIGCQSLLRRAGQPVPRRGRGASAVPPELRAVGVTSREVDVLRLVGERLGNTEIGTRLFLSPRTVEKHVASLIVKTRRSDRRELATYATRLFGR